MKKIAIVFGNKDKLFWKRISKEIKEIFEGSKINCFWKNTLKEKDLERKKLVITLGEMEPFSQQVIL